MKNLDQENLELKITKCKFFKNEGVWLKHHLSESEYIPKYQNPKQF